MRKKECMYRNIMNQQVIVKEKGKINTQIIVGKEAAEKMKKKNEEKEEERENVLDYEEESEEEDVDVKK